MLYETSRVIFKDGCIAFGGRTEDAQIPAQLVGPLEMRRFLPLAAKLGEVFQDSAAVLYGEGYGARFQKGGENYPRRPGLRAVRRAKVGQWWLPRAAVEDVAQKLRTRRCAGDRRRHSA